MNNRPSVSVVLPVLNEASRLPECLNSLLNQTYPNYEIVVVDNGSTDNTFRIIEDFKKTFPRIVYVYEAEKTCGSARNTGERLSRGSIVLMTDADCLVPSDWIEKMVSPILSSECDAVQGGEKSKTDHFVGRMIESKSDRKYAPLLFLRNKELPGYVDTKNFAIRRDSLAAVGFSPRGHASNDTALAIALSRTHIVMRILNNVKVRHDNPGSFKELAGKQFSRAFWLHHVTQRHRAYLSGSPFLKNTNQAAQSFYAFFPGLCLTLIRKGFAHFFFDLVEGMAWRMGLLYGSLKNSRKI